MATRREAMNAKMFEVIERISDAVEGEDKEVLAFACCTLIVYCLSTAPAEHRDRLRKNIWGFFKRLAEPPRSK